MFDASSCVTGTVKRRAEFGRATKIELGFGAAVPLCRNLHGV